jgi:hypothetical protein
MDARTPSGTTELVVYVEVDAMTISWKGMFNYIFPHVVFSTGFYTR